MSPLAYSPEAVDFVRRWKQLPFLQGHRASAGAIRALIDHQTARVRPRRPTCPRIRTAPRRSDP